MYIYIYEPSLILRSRFSWRTSASLRSLPGPSLRLDASSSLLRPGMSLLRPGMSLCQLCESPLPRVYDCQYSLSLSLSLSHTHTHTTHTHTHVYVCKHVTCTQNIQTPCQHPHTCIHTHTAPGINPAHVRPPTHTYTYTDLHTCKHTNTHTHIHTQHRESTPLIMSDPCDVSASELSNSSAL